VGLGAGARPLTGDEKFYLILLELGEFVFLLIEEVCNYSKSDLNRALHLLGQRMSCDVLLLAVIYPS
jgi:hypothetical protein